MAFSKAIVLAKNEQSLAFMVKFVSHEVLKKVLQKNNYELLRKFIGTESIMENSGSITYRINRRAEANQSQIEKFKLLLEINESGVEQAFRAYEPQEEITDLMKKNFEMALDTRRKEKNIIISTSKTSGPIDIK